MMMMADQVGEVREGGEAAHTQQSADQPRHVRYEGLGGLMQEERHQRYGGEVRISSLSYH